MIYVITAVHNRYKITEAFVEQLLMQSYKDIRLILVDDGCVDGTSDMVKEKMPDAIIIHGNGELWWGGALHEAYKWIKNNAKKDAYIMIANDDTEFEPNYIENAISFLQAKQHTLLTGYGISKQTGKVIDAAINFDFKKSGFTKRNIGAGNCASTRSLFFRVTDFLLIGGFHPRVLPHYGSDYEWTIRASRKHQYLIFCDEKITYLVNEKTTGDNQYSSMTCKKMFSKRSSSNPIYKMIFIFMVTPCRLLPIAVWNQIGRYLKKWRLIIEILKR